MSDPVVVARPEPASVVVVSQQASTVVTRPVPASVVTASAQGVAGPPGDSFTFAQGTPDDTWMVHHGLGYYPAVSVIRSDHTEVIGFEVSHLDADSLTITFSGAMSGMARLT